jgi:hypothetical protein
MEKSFHTMSCKESFNFTLKKWREIYKITLVPEVYFYYFHCEGERKNKPLVESGN